MPKPNSGSTFVPAASKASNSVDKSPLTASSPISSARDANLIVELDGGQHAEQQDYDAERTKVLNNCGYKVLRYWNNEVLENMDGVLEDIRSVLLDGQ